MNYFVEITLENQGMILTVATIKINNTRKYKQNFALRDTHAA